MGWSGVKSHGESEISISVCIHFFVTLNEACKLFDGLEKYRAVLRVERLKGRLKLIPAQHYRTDNVAHVEVGRPRKRRRLEQSRRDFTPSDDIFDFETLLQELNEQKDPDVTVQREKKRRRIDDDISNDLRDTASETSWMDFVGETEFDGQDVGFDNLDVGVDDRDVGVNDRDAMMDDMEYDPSANYDDTEQWWSATKDRPNFAFGGDVIAAQRREPPTRKKRNNKKSTRETCDERGCSHAREVLKLKEKICKQYVFVPRHVELKYADDKTTMIAWFGPMQVEFLMDLDHNWLYAVFLASGSFKLNSVNVVLGRHVMKFCGKFAPGFGLATNVCCLSVCLSRQI